MANEVNIVVKGKNEAKAALTSAQSDTNKLGKATEGAKNKLGLFKLAAGGLAASGLVRFLKSSTAEARESEKVNAQTAAVIKSTGGAAKVTAKQFGDLATSISNKTGIDDEQIQSSENMLATFTNVRNEVGKGNDIFSQATQTVTDMSVALGQDGKNSAIQLGKALNDPIKGITALSRVGVTFTAQQKDQIKTLVESGNRMGAQKVILGELTKEFGGSAAAQATAGDKARTSWKNMQEEVGTKLIPVIDKLETWLSTKIVPALMNVVDFISRNIAVIGPLAAVIGTVIAVVKAWTLAQAALDVVLTANPIGLIIAAIAGLAVALVIAWKRSETFRDVVKGVFSTISNVVRHFAAFMADWFLQPLLTIFGLIIHGAAAAFGWIPGIGPKLKAAAHKFDQFKADVNSAIDKIRGVKKIKVQPDYASAASTRAWLNNYINKLGNSFPQLGPVVPHGPSIPGVTAHAGGGVAGGNVIMNEQGPEAVRLPQGSMVYPAGTTRGMGGGGGPVLVQLEVVGGGGSEFESFMLEMMRRFVRVKGGGNVQTALGR
jgi:hypothetical protein